MKRRIAKIGLISLTGALVGATLPLAPPSFADSRPGKSKTVRPPTVPASETMPVPTFEPNVGQSEERVRFLSRGSGYTLFLTDSEAVVSLTRTSPEIGAAVAASADGRLTTADINDLAGVQRPQAATAVVVRMRFEGANRRPEISAHDEVTTKTNYFIGNDPINWRSNVPNYSTVRYHDLYEGIDLIFASRGGQLEYDFVVNPGANPKQIRLSFEGAKSLSLSSEGDLIQRLPGGGSIRQEAPVTYQTVGGEQRQVLSRFELANDEIRFRVGPHDPNRPLVIDPVLTYSSFLGGGGGDSVRGIAVDARGNTYLAGTTQSGDFPTSAGAMYPERPSQSNGPDLWVAKLSPQKEIIYATYLGGAANSDFLGNRVAIDELGAAYLAGTTHASDFPTTPGALDTSYGGQGDVFFVKLAPDGSRLDYATFLGGSQHDDHGNVALDASRSIYISGSTRSTEFPATAGAFQSAGPRGTDAFVAKFAPDATSLVYATYIGGANVDYARALDVDPAGNAYIAGQTASTDFPTTPGAFQVVPTQDPPGSTSTDAFAAKIAPDGRSLVYSTYVSGSSLEYAEGIAVGSDGAAYLTGPTLSEDFPVSPGAFQPQLRGGIDVFVTKVTPDGRDLAYSSYLGGAKGGEFGYLAEGGRNIAVGPDGSAYVTGHTWNTPDFPTTSDAFQPGQPETPDASGSSDMDAFLTRVHPSGTRLVESSYLGGRHADFGFSLVVDASETVHVAGVTTSCDFPVTEDALQGEKRNRSGNIISNGFLSEVDSGDPRELQQGACGLPAPVPGPGALDRSFDRDGIVTTQLVEDRVEAAEAVAVQRDGKIIVAGSSYGNLGMGKTVAQFVIARYHADGNLDDTFGNKGIVVTPLSVNQGAFAPSAQVRDLVLQPDGNFLALGGAGQIYDERSVLVRYRANGSIDDGFGNGGVVVNAAKGLSAIVLQDDGRIVVGGSTAIDRSDAQPNSGFELARYNADGSPDQSFGQGGAVKTAVANGGIGNDLVIQSDGKFVMAGYSGIPKNSRATNFTLARWRGDGSLDQGFGDNGFVVVDLSRQAQDQARAVDVDGDGRIVAVGFARGKNGHNEFALVRLTGDGTLDTTFGDGGRVLTDLLGYHDEASDLAIDDGGSIMVAGRADSGRAQGGGGLFALARYGSSGAPDARFGAGGRVVTDVERPGGNHDPYPRGTDAAWSLALQDDGKAIVAGVADFEKDDNFATPIKGTFTVARYLAALEPPNIVTPREGAAVNSPVTLGGEADAGATIVVSEGARVLGEATVSARGSWKVLADLADGPHSVTVTANDSTGNHSEPAERSFTVTNQPVPPDPPAVSSPSPNEAFNLGTLRIRGIAWNGSRVVLSEEGSVVGTARVGRDDGWTTRVAFGAGPHTVSARTVDARGQASAATTITFDIAEGASDSYFTQQWSLQQTNTPKAWLQPYATGFGIKVAVIDTGVHLSHEDLQCAGKFDLVRHSDLVAYDNRPDDPNSDGTMAAGIIGACTNNGLGIAGVAPEATLMPIRIFDIFRSTPYERAIEGVRKAVDAGAHVINISKDVPNSWLSPQSFLDDAINYAVSKGVVVVAAAGDSGRDSGPVPFCNYPGSAAGVVCVGAVDRRDVKSATSGFAHKGR